MDSIIQSSERLPNNILEAQQDRHSVYLRVSICFPENDPGDGDGLPSTRLIKIHGLYTNEIATNDNILLNSLHFRKVREAVGSSIRCRLMAYDTQESPRRDRRDEGVPQPFWQAGRDFLIAQLQVLRGTFRPHEAAILADCYGVDLFGRLLIDIRGIHHLTNLELEHIPSMARFELAKRCLESGFAHPTYSSYTNVVLLDAFVSARENSRGAFADSREFVHPSLCRKRRWEMDKNTTKARRRRYSD